MISPAEDSARQIPSDAIWTTHIYALLPHPSHPEVLGISTTGGPCLPHARLVGQINPSQVDRVIAALGEGWEFPFNVLRCLAFETSPCDSRTDGLFLLEAREGHSSSEAYLGDLIWISLDDLHSIPLPDVLWSSLAGWLKERNEQAGQNLPHLHSPWARSGWYAQAEAWISTKIARLGSPVRAIQPVRSWCISAVMRVETTTRPAYFKATLDLPLFVNEGEVMAGLSQLYPDHIPAPLAVDADRNWMLLEDLGEPLGRKASLEQKVELFQKMAHIQVDSSSRIDSLIQMGCIDRRIPWLQSLLDALLSDEVATSHLTQEELEELRHALPRLQTLLAELDILPIPPALIHGDLHTGNVAVRNRNIQIFDWTDAAISHPFFDLDVIFSTEDTNARRVLEAAYLSIWEQTYPADQVRRAFELSRVVYGLYHAISYQFILNNLEEADRSEINSAHYFFRQVLKELATFPESSV